MKLFKLLPKESMRGIRECQSMTDIDSCLKIDINFDALKEKSDLTLVDDDIVFKHSYTEVNEDFTATLSYETDDLDTAVFLYSELSGYPEIGGSFTVKESKYIIDNCKEDCHVLIKMGAKMLHSKPEPEISSALGKLRVSESEVRDHRKYNPFL